MDPQPFHGESVRLFDSSQKTRTNFIGKALFNLSWRSTERVRDCCTRSNEYRRRPRRLPRSRGRRRRARLRTLKRASGPACCRSKPSKWRSHARTGSDRRMQGLCASGWKGNGRSGGRRWPSVDRRSQAVQMRGLLQIFDTVFFKTLPKSDRDPNQVGFRT
jgi:hypothetical protein